MVASSADLGQLEKIDVRHNGLYLVELWRLEKVVVKAAWEGRE